jgi:type II secretory pathway pseudopilin PulG
MSNRRAVSVIELLVVIAIIAVLLGLLLPAVGAAQRRAMETVCKNNLGQINLAVAQFVETQKRLPAPGNSGVVGGWTIEVLPFLDQKNLRDRVTPGGPISAAPEILLRQPRILTCPIRAAADPPDATAMDHAHYILVPLAGRQSYNVFDAPLDVQVPWASGPEMAYADVVRQIGPHNRGFFFARGFQNGVNFMPNSQEGP